ncbi:tryptophan synthase beta subunit-like PLP-dependent enzyme [Chytriomyces cf. hyalinus JEL632]|nr:tryptophan synthase beta subunit-like PLP-dependent enzyme [Chytriomyces cf. hyalinus JEL632]
MKEMSRSSNGTTSVAKRPKTHKSHEDGTGDGDTGIHVNKWAKPVAEHGTIGTETDYLKLILTANVYDVAIETPLQTAHNLSNKLKNNILLKREDLQPVFSFKLRGAYNRMQQLTKAEKEAGVIACSAGNHAQGVALAAQKMGIKAKIVMPLATPPIKIRNVKRLGAEVVLFGNDFDEAKIECARLTEVNKLTNIPPYDDPYVIAGQGTIGVEILRQVQNNQNIEAIFVCVGGGGLAAGIASYIKRVVPHIKIIGVETFDSDAMTQSIKLGKRVLLEDVGLFADGAAVRLVGEETFRICKDLVDEMVLVSTDEICAAIKDIFEDTRSIVEPAGALGMAGMKKYIAHNRVEGKTFVSICSGANMNFDRLRFVADRADFGEQKEALISVSIPEKPGSFMALYRAIHPRNVTEFSYRYGNADLATVIVSMRVEDREKELADIFQTLEKHGMKGIDASNNEMGKAHGRYLVGGRIEVPHERVFRFTFPERPGALHHFLDSLSGTTESQQLSCSLFHYRNYGGDMGKVFVGIQVPPTATKVFDDFMDKLKYPYVEETSNEVYRQLLRAGN